jgi:hypothetical protein
VIITKPLVVTIFPKVIITNTLVVTIFTKGIVSKESVQKTV